MRVAVIGAGVVGLSTTFFLTSAGHDVECFEAGYPMAQRSAGGTRIFRLAHGSPELVELAVRARNLFGRWAADGGTPIIGSEGLLLAGPEAQLWASAMSAAGVPGGLHDGPRAAHSLRRPGLGLDEPVLVDPAGGVLNAAAVSRYLLKATGHLVRRERVSGLTVRPGGVDVRGRAAGRKFDVVIIAAGDRTTQLGQYVGLDLRDAVSHHARFSFPLSRARPSAPCVIDKSEKWRKGITTYEHLSAPDRWAVGVHAPAGLVGAHRGRTSVVEDLRKIASAYVAENLRDVSAMPTEELYCTISSSWDDGYTIARNECALAVQGDNLFKFAPVLGKELAEAAVEGREAPSPARRR